MRAITRDYLEGNISRRGFISRMSRAGFSAFAVTSALESLSPFARSSPSVSGSSNGSMIPFEGTGGEVLAEQLKAAGVRYLFLGNASGLGALCDALVDRPEMQIVLALHENHCVSMADGFAKASGKTGFAMFSQVGTPNASSNMYNAMKDRTPLVLACDHRDADVAGRDAKEDIEDWLETVEQFTKFRWLVQAPERIPEWVTKAFKVASTMPGGPTMLRFATGALYARNIQAGVFAPGTFDIPMYIRPNSREVEQAAKILLEAESPLLYLGSEVFASGAVSSVVELAELVGIPVTQAESWAANFPTNHPLFLGEYFAPMRYPEKVDVFLNLGAHMPDPGRFDRRYLGQSKIIHARVEPYNLGTAFPVEVAIAANVKEVAVDLIESIKSHATKARLAQMSQSRLAATQQFRKKIEQSRHAVAKRKWDQVPLTWERVAFEISATLDRDAYVVPEFGTQGPRCMQYFTFAEGEKTRIGRTEGSALGWGVGAAVGVKLARPDKQVVCLQGDGGFLFGQIEALWTMSRYDIPIILVIFNNRCYNETRVRMFSRGGRQAQEQKDMLCHLGDPEVDFVGVAAGFGIRGEQVSKPDQVRVAMSRAIKATRDGRPYLIDAVVERSGAGADLAWYPDFSVGKLKM